MSNTSTSAMIAYSRYSGLLRFDVGKWRSRDGNRRLLGRKIIIDKLALLFVNLRNLSILMSLFTELSHYCRLLWYQSSAIVSWMSQNKIKLNHYLDLTRLLYNVWSSANCQLAMYSREAPQLVYKRIQVALEVALQASINDRWLNVKQTTVLFLKSSNKPFNAFSSR